MATKLVGVAVVVVVNEEVETGEDEVEVEVEVETGEDEVEVEVEEDKGFCWDLFKNDWEGKAIWLFIAGGVVAKLLLLASVIAGLVERENFLEAAKKSLKKKKKKGGKIKWERKYIKKGKK